MGPIIFGFVRMVTAGPMLLRGRGQAGMAQASMQPRYGPGAQPYGPGGQPYVPGAQPAPWAGQAGQAPWGGATGSAATSIGAPPVLGTAVVGAAPVAGWYADPSGTSQYRWWDGASWTEHVR
ncbi:MAG TPA: DUF2510 domain-containing protein [Acidimicrobiales bacterium]|nr:DUF2510 domain-containing protein [Acidimicrobiales bacterium]